MTLGNRYERRHAQSAPPPNILTDDDLADIGETVNDVLDYLHAAGKTPRATQIR